MSSRTAAGPSLRVVVIIAAVVVGLIAAAVGLALAGQPERGEITERGVPIGSSRDGARTIVVHEDPQCPFCARFKAEAADELEAIAADEAWELTYQVHTFLDDRAGGDTSLRASAAALCAHDEGRFEDYRSIMFANHPALSPNGPPWTNETLADFGEHAGLSKSFRSCVMKGSRVEAARSLNASSDQVEFVPLVVVDGEPLTREQMEALWDGRSSLLNLIGG